MLAYCLLVDKAIICARQVGELSGINFLHCDVASTLQAAWIERFGFSLLPAILNAFVGIVTNDGFRPIRLHRINGHLAWKVEEIRRLLSSAR